jgi:hypothetical protein
MQETEIKISLYLNNRHDSNCIHNQTVKEGEFAGVQHGSINAVNSNEQTRQEEHSAEDIHGAANVGEPAAGAEVKHGRREGCAALGTMWRGRTCSAASRNANML